VVSEFEYLALRNRPLGKPAMYQNWRDLLFLHISAPPQEAQRLLPRTLDIDTFPNEQGEERAWIGLVPFRMEGIRFRGLPALPWLSAFPETNVRTYVHQDGKTPGVWFFSLDAARWLACKYARLVFKLPYFHALMRAVRNGAALHYESKRPEGPQAKSTDRCRAGY